ncbi:hypothetical protein FOZ61_001356 [Perkinsus olseni]|uniref:Rad21/Rec8-like protein N-terminal domain-containing protein n=1 Tax=Perkinsus olseni TaxID=32597 RepID=A0A7J6LXW9_PEROL|nr:hypothetical protein FOZ61_001356 [Perkinsus olseni]
MAPPPSPPSSVAAPSSLTSTTSISSVAKDVPSLQKDFTEFWVAATRVVRLKRGQIDIDIAKKVSQLMKAILSAAHRGQQNALPQGRKDKRQVSLRVYGLLIKGACVLFSRKADLVLRRCDAVMAKFRETLRSTKGIADDEDDDEERGAAAAAAAKKRKKGKQRKRKVVQDDQDADPSPGEGGSDGAERRVRRRAGSDHPPSVGDSVTTRLAETPPSEGNGAAEDDDDGRRRNEEGLIESGEVVGNSQLPIMTSAELRELSISSEGGGGAGDGPPPPPSLPDELIDPPPTPSAHDNTPGVPGSPPAPSPGPQQPTASSVSTAVRRPRAKRRAAGSSGRKRRRLDRQVYIGEADYDQWAQNDEPITRTREMQWRPADYVRNAPSLTRLDFLGPDLTRGIEEGGRLLLGVLGGGEPPITPNEDMEVDELRDQPDAVQLEETFLDPPTPLDTSLMDGRKERVSLLSDVFARTPQSSPSEPNTPRSQQYSLSGQHQQPDSAKFPPTHLSTETLRPSADPNTQVNSQGRLRGFNSHTYAFKNLIRDTVTRQEADGNSEDPKVALFSTLAPAGPDGAPRDLAVKSLYHTLLLAAHGEIDARQATPFGPISLTIREPEIITPSAVA